MMKKNRKIIYIFFSILALCIIIYFIFNGWFIAYTDDAYLRGNLIIVSPRVEGHIQTVYVKNSQYVKKGELLLELDSTPFKLKLNVNKATLKEAQTELSIQKHNWQIAQNKLKSVIEQYKIAKLQTNRYQHLSKIGAVSVQDFEEKMSYLDKIQNELSDAEQKCEYWQETINAQTSTIDADKSKVALAEYYLKQTKIYSSADGCIINCNVRPGDYATQGSGLFSIIEDEGWWVKANYKEGVLRKIKPGQKVLVFIRMYPFHLFKGIVKSIARGTMRNKKKSKPLPYVKPTTEWVKEQRRFTVIINFTEQLPSSIKFCEGANARTFIYL